MEIWRKKASSIICRLFAANKTIQGQGRGVRDKNYYFNFTSQTFFPLKSLGNNLENIPY